MYNLPVNILNTANNLSMKRVPLVPILPTPHSSFYSDFGLFYYFFETLPHKISENNLDVREARAWFLERYAAQVQESFYMKSCFDNTLKAEVDDAVYVLHPDLLIYFDTQKSLIKYLFKKTEWAVVEELVERLNQFKMKPNKKAELFLVVAGNGRFDLEKFALREQKLSLNQNYNSDFEPVHKLIIERLSKDRDKGLVLLHGEPGTGKTSYLRYLTQFLQKKVIFLPPNMAEAITQPHFLPMLVENPNSVLVIEDAENILLDRNQRDSSAVSALLNLSDGLLADCLSIQIICTFNTDLAKVDSALLRKGRLIASYKFEPLSVEKARQLSKKLGQELSIEKPIRLTDIYNQKEKPGELIESRKIGF